MRYIWVVLCLVGCGGKLTDEQKTEVTSLLESVGQAQREAQLAQGCDRTDFHPDAAQVSSLVPKAAKTGFLLEGKACPLRMKFLFTSLGESTSLDLDYSITEASYAEKTDVQEIKFSGEIKSAVGSFSGNIRSRKFGKVEASVDLASDRAALHFHFPKFSAEFLAFTMQGKATYSLNGELISREQFYGTLGKAGNVFTRFVQVASPDTDKDELKTESSHDVPDAVSVQAPQVSPPTPSNASGASS